MRIGIFIVATCVGMTALVQASEPSSVDAAVGRLLVQMFNSGYVRGSNSLPQAQRSYEAARELSKSDPRVDYGFGLVLLKQLRNKEALAHFQTITKRSGPEYWPAWQALIWMHFVAADYTAGYERLKEFANRVSRMDDDNEASEQEQLAEWIGQVMEALQISAETPKQREMIQQTEQELTELLGPDLETSLARGRASIQLLHSLAKSDLLETKEVEEAKLKKETAEKQAQIAKELEATTQKRESLQKTAEDSKKAFDEQLASVDKQLTRLERDYDFLQKRILSLTVSQAQLNAEMAILSQQISANNGASNAVRRQNDTFNQQRMTMLEAQMVKYQVDLDQTVASTLLVAQRAQLTIGQRSSIVRQRERITGEVTARNTALDKWQDRLKDDVEKLKTTPKAKPLAVIGKAQRTRSFRTYINLDLTTERDRIITDFGTAASKLPGSK